MAPNIAGLALGIFFTWTGMDLAKPEVRKAILRNLIAYSTVVLGAITVVSHPSSGCVHCPTGADNEAHNRCRGEALTGSIDAARTHSS
eukprot:2675447-Rhodomonas_salina.1